MPSIFHETMFLTLYRIFDYIAELHH